jgi:tryptophan halogenase
MQHPNQLSFCVVGSGTAGLITSIVLRQSFPNAEITNISSSKIGIVGVGEGSTEHWRMFMERCNIGIDELIKNTGATHKYGIRFENWTDKNPDYFHSVSGVEEIEAWGTIGEYLSFIENEKLLTTQTGSIGLTQDKIVRENLHNNTNQYHFDTFMLNDFLIGVCFKRMIRFVDDEVGSLELDANGNIKSATLVSGMKLSADIWIDATGFKRELMGRLDNKSWKSFAGELIVDSAIAFPTEPDPNGKIRPYTRAIGASSGWMWEIPTQTRRGNGYVYSSAHLSDEQALEEARKISGYNIEPARSFRFDPGYFSEQWKGNCICVGLASSFVEPLEATSIGSTIIQAMHIAQYCGSFIPGSNKLVADYNKKMESMMLNIRDMIRLHYMSDRKDTKFWRDASTSPVSDSLQSIIDLWSEKAPGHMDIPYSTNLMFLTRHFVHVAQGQGLVSSMPSSLTMDRFNIRGIVEKKSDQMRTSRYSRELVDHKKALMETVNEN